MTSCLHPAPRHVGPRLCPAAGAGAALLLVSTLALAGCGSRNPPPASASAAEPATAGTPAAAPAAEVVDEGFVVRAARQAIERARDRIAEGNITVGGANGAGNRVLWQGAASSAADAPRAEISPQGDFIVDGRPVPVDAAQRERLLDYRAHTVAIADAGMAVGVQGAQLGLGAARDALGAVLGGQTGDFERRIEAGSERLKLDAMRICDRMPALLASQRALAEALPAFAPYAGMTPSDIDDCRRDAGGAQRDAGHTDAPADMPVDVPMETLTGGSAGGSALRPADIPEDMSAAAAAERAPPHPRP